MTTAKWIWRLALSVLAIFATTANGESPLGFFREVCKYRKGKLRHSAAVRSWAAAVARDVEWNPVHSAPEGIQIISYAKDFKKGRLKGDAFKIVKNWLEKAFQPVSIHRDRVEALRAQMRMRATLLGPEINAYLLPSYDEHLNVELAPRDQRLQYLTGFTGTNAVAVVTMNSAALWVENRYVQQADGQLNCDWEIFRMNDTMTIADWLNTKLYARQRVGADPHLVPHHLWQRWRAELHDKFLELRKISNNLIDIIWGDERPPPDDRTIQVQEREFAGQRWEDKVEELRKLLHEQQCDAMIVTSLTEIAYLLNIRGRDIPYTPVVKSYVVVTMDDIFFYVDHSKLNMIVDLHLHTDCYNEKCVKIKAYNKVWNDLRTNAQVWQRVLVPAPCVLEQGASEEIFSSLPEKIIHEAISPIIFMRAQKNSEEQKCMREAHIKDGAAICEAMSNLEIRFFTEQWTEEKIKYEIERSRLSQKHSKGLSLRTVVAYGDHSSLPYYISSNITDIEVTDQSLLVIESGGQYLEGTTDVSRTFIFGDPTAEMKAAYTNVLAGILRLTQLKFPEDLKPSEVDALVRSSVWESMNDYPQATGHGIGAYGAVQEPPISVAYGMNVSFPFKEGYFFSSESGYYQRGDFGVRLKNVLQVVDTGKTHTSGKKFLAFHDVTLVPFEPKLIEGSLLSALEKRWLNEHNTKIRQHVGNELKRQGNMIAFYWMMNKTRHIVEYLPEDEYRAARGSGSRTRSFLTITVPAILLGLTVFGTFLKWLL